MINRKIIFDTDPGIDDAIAISAAVKNNLNIELITTVFGNVNVDITTDNALKLVDFLGKDIPVAKGIDKAIIFRPNRNASAIHGANGMGGYELPKTNKKVLEKSAVEAIKDIVVNSDEKITLVAVGSLTNIAVFLMLYPHLKERIEEIVIMGGSLSGGNVNSVVEANIFQDPHAAKIVFDSGCKITAFGLDVTRNCLISPKSFEGLKGNGKMADMAYNILKGYMEVRGVLTMHDSATIAYLLHPDMFEFEDMYIDVATEGAAIGSLVSGSWTPEKNKENNIKYAVKVDSDRFEKWLIESLKK